MWKILIKENTNAKIFVDYNTNALNYQELIENIIEEKRRGTCMAAQWIWFINKTQNKVLLNTIKRYSNIR